MTGIFGTSLNSRNGNSPDSSTSEELDTVNEFPRSEQAVVAPEDAAATEIETSDLEKVSYDQIAGNFNPAEGALISEEYQIKQDEEPRSERSTSEKGSIRLLTVTGGIGGILAAIALGWFGFIAPKSPVQKAAKPEPTQTPTATAPDQTAALKGQLAFAEQQRQIEQNNKSTGKPNPTGADSKDNKKKSAAATSPRSAQARVEPPRRSSTSSRMIDQPPVRTVAQRSIEPRTPVSSPRPVPTTPTRSQVEKPVDPNERWKQLAELGQQEASGKSTADPVASANAATTDSSITPESSQSRTPRTENSPTPTSPNSAEIQTATIGDAPTPNFSTSEGEQGILSQQIPAVDPPKSTIIATDASLQSGEIPLEDTALFDEVPTNKANDKLNQDASTSETREVTLGSSVQGTVVVPLVWSQDSRTQTPERGAIRLDEPLLAKDGTVALPAGTTLITQTSSTSGVPTTNIIAVIRNRNGNVQQYPLPANILVVRSETGEPLSGKNINEVNPALLRGDDLIAGAIGGLGQIGELLNRPDVESSSTVSGGGFSQSTTSRSRSPNVVGAILQGALQPATQRIEQRIQQRERTQERRENLPNVAVIPKGQRVMIVAQNILRVNP